MSLQLNEFAHEAHRRFIERVAASGRVWGLRDGQGWITVESNEDPDRRVFPFWSDAAYARRCVKGPWAGFQPTSIPLDKFLGVWLPGMDLDGCLAGTNWDGELRGAEIYPLSLKRALEDALGIS